MHWQLSHRCDSIVRPLADRHYNRQHIGAVNFVPPGRCVVLSIPDAAFWVTSWPFAEYVRHAWPGAWVCSAFRNEAPDRYLSSDLIRQQWRHRARCGRRQRSGSSRSSTRRRLATSATRDAAISKRGGTIRRASSARKQRCSSTIESMASFRSRSICQKAKGAAPVLTPATPTRRAACALYSSSRTRCPRQRWRSDSK